MIPAYDACMFIASLGLVKCSIKLITIVTYAIELSVVGDMVGLEVLNFDEKQSVVLFSKNWRAIGTRYVTIADLHQLLPTVTVCGNGYRVEIDVFWQNQYLKGPAFSEVRTSVYTDRHLGKNQYLHRQTFSEVRTSIYTDRHLVR